MLKEFSSLVWASYDSAQVKAVRAEVAKARRDPNSVKIFTYITLILGRTKEEAEAKYQRALKYASEEGGLACWCGNTNIDLSKFDLDKEITAKDAKNSDVAIYSKIANLYTEDMMYQRGLLKILERR